MEAPIAIMEDVGCIISVKRLLKMRNNLEESQKQYKQYGEWWEWVFEVIPINKIELREPWNALRFYDNLTKLKDTGKMPPIRVCFYDDRTLFSIEDGIHRIASAKRLGYTKIPAIVAYRHTYPP